jgi:hypothetical protein
MDFDMSNSLKFPIVVSQNVTPATGEIPWFAYALNLPPPIGALLGGGASRDEAILNLQQAIVTALKSAQASGITFTQDEITLED